MNISRIFILRPVATSLFMVALAFAGGLAYRALPVNDLPNVDFPTIQVSAHLPGASPQTMATSVATPLEKQFSTIAGIDSMSSVSGQGSTTVTLQFVLERDIDAAAQDVQAAISRVLRQLPPEMTSPPSYSKSNPADQPIVMMSLTSSTLPLSELNEYGETILAQRLSMLQGVSQVQVYGSQKFAVRIRLDPAALSACGLGVNEVAEAVSRANTNLPTGILYGPHRSLTIEAEGQLMSADGFRQVVVAFRGGRPVRLSDVASVIDSVENDKLAAWYCEPGSRQRAMVLAVQRQPGTNTIEVAERIKSVIPSMRALLPPSASLNLLFDRSESIRDSFGEVRMTLVLALILVAVVIYPFLRRLSATVAVSLSMPFSILATFAVMHLLGYSLNNISLMALILAIGFVVDDAIVMLENIVRHRESGKEPLAAALDGSAEVGFTIVSMTLSLAAVFIPVLFMGGLVGRLFREFAVTIAVAVLASGVVSLTLTPMLTARILRFHGDRKEGALSAFFDRAFGVMTSFYGTCLRAALRREGLMLLLTAATLAATGYAFYKIPKGFLPSEDRDMIIVNTEAAEGTPFRTMVEKQEAAMAVVQAQPGVSAFMANVGRGGGNKGMMFVRLSPRGERKKSADAMIQELRPRLAVIPGLRAFAVNPASIMVGGRMSKGQYQYTLQGPDIAELYRCAAGLEEKLGRIPVLQDVSSDLQLRNPQLSLRLDRDRASSFGLSAQAIESALSYAYGSRQVSTILGDNDDYAVIMELMPEYQEDAAALSLLHIRSPGGELVPLMAVATAEEGTGPLSVSHSGQLPSVTLSFNTRPGAALGDAIVAVEAEADAAVPPTVARSFQGTAQAFQSSMKGLGFLLAASIVVIYIVLGILYENLWHPLTILSALPFAGLGALLSLMAFGMDLSLYAFVGIIMLVGLVKKNGIMMVDFALQAQKEEGLSPEEAMHKACLIRFRPIMMTTMAALVASLPIALAWGGGAEARRPLGIAVTGGLIFSQLLTLFVTPAIFVLMERLQRLLKSGLSRTPA